MIVGTATFRIVLSSTMMNSALDSTTNATHRFGSREAVTFIMTVPLTVFRRSAYSVRPT